MTIGFSRLIALPTHSFMGGNLPSGATLTRASIGWVTSNAGVLTSTAIDGARFCYHPSALSTQGILNEPAATNSIRNASMTGAAAGTPGTAPTNWTITGASLGLTRTIVGTGTEDGLPYIDVRWAGTTSSAGNLTIQPETTTGVVASLGQAWTCSACMRLTAGTLAGHSAPPNMAMNERAAAGTALGGAVGTVEYTPTSAALRTQRIDSSITTVQATVARITCRTVFTLANSAAVDFTMRFGAPQLVQASRASSLILTTAGAIVRAADVLTIGSLSGSHDIDIDRVEGRSTLLNVDCSGGSYVVPTSVSPLLSVTMR